MGPGKLDRLFARGNRRSFASPCIRTFWISAWSRRENILVCSVRDSVDGDRRVVLFGGSLPRFRLNMASFCPVNGGAWCARLRDPGGDDPFHDGIWTSRRLTERPNGTQDGGAATALP